MGQSSPVDDEFLEAMSRFATGVVVVTTLLDGKPHGSTAQAFCSVSLEPKLVLVSLKSSGRTIHGLVQTKQFAINILASSQKAVAEIFADPSIDPATRFSSTSFTVGNAGIPVLSDSLAYVECSLRSTYTEGDHTIAIGLVNAVVLGEDRLPLLYYKRSYASLHR